VAHDCIVGSHCVLANHASLAGHVRIADWVILGGFSGVHQFVQVGTHAFIANNAAVTLDVPPYVMAVGQPAGAHSVNSEGLKRRGFGPGQIRNIREAFRLLYRSGLKLTEASERLTALAQEQPELRALADFLPRATRGIVR
jgi:UDP-N-acetylglucosamine acyltransferase